ncbi:HU family DNA-binding protein [Lysinibacillus sp. FSL K6-0102]|uniref:HU family DNA-binding protein n=1 Tax=Lysinibacillus sp. FSL K6-0102 TaxID=2975290 RepID=UPI0030FC289F
MNNAKRDDLKRELKNVLNNNQKFINSISKSNQKGVSLDDTDFIIDSMLSTIIKLTDEHNELMLQGFGSFKSVIRNQRKYSNFGKDEITVEAKRVPKFKAGKTFNDIVKR